MLKSHHTLKYYTFFICLSTLCSQICLEEVEHETGAVGNGSNPSYSQDYFPSINKKKINTQLNEDDKTEETNIPLEGTILPRSLISNAVLASGLSESGQIPVVVTVLDGGTSDLSQRASEILKHDLEVIKNKTRSLPNLTQLPHNDSTVGLGSSDLTIENLGSTTLPNLQRPQPPSGNDENSTTSKNDSAKTQTPSEDIPSFREWTQKQLAEAEKKNGENLTVPSIVSKNVKIRSKNYASPDCGAKIVGSNAEAKSPNSVLSPSRDEYILSPCTSKIWLAVELCESIQAKKIELANFELFSSSPREFTVSVADRWPTKDWTIVGQLTAKDERTVQSFALQPSLFAKYMKLEFHSHYGSEHFCPVSLLRVFGTSEIDVLENDHHEVHDLDDDDDDFEGADNGEPGNNIFGSARDAVISIVKKAAQVLTPHTKNRTFLSNNENVPDEDDRVDDEMSSIIDLTCFTPSHIIVCDNCTDGLYHLVFNILSCKNKQLEDLLFYSNFINKIFKESSICQHYGLDFNNIITTTENTLPKIIKKTTNVPNFNKEMKYINSLLKTETIAALCNILAINEHKVVLNITNIESTGVIDETLKNEVTNEEIIKHVIVDSEVVNVEDETIKIEPFIEKDNILNETPQQQYCTIESSLIAFPKTTVVSDEDQSNTLNTYKNNIMSKILATYQSKEYYNTNSEILYSRHIKPTKTMADNVRGEHNDNVDNINELSDDLKNIIVNPTTVIIPQYNTHPHIIQQNNNHENNIRKIENEEETVQSNPKVAEEKIIERDMSPDFPSTPLPPEEETSQNVESLENLFSELEEAEHQQHSSAAATTHPPQQQLKESVLIRLANRIKSLERNMSLSGQYLDELSRRYKRQIEELTRALNEAIDERRRGEQRELKLTYELSVLAQQLATLTVSVDTLLSERDSWMYKVSTFGQHCVIIFIELLIFCAVLYLCRMIPEVDLCERKISIGWPRRSVIPPPPQRRKSDTVLNKDEEPKKRRPSEEALKSSGTTHSELIITRVNLENQLKSNNKAEKRKKRKKKDGVATSNSSSKLKLSSSYSTLPAVLKQTSLTSYDDNQSLKRTSSSDHIKWFDQINENLLIKNSFEPLQSASPENSPQSHIFNTAMSSRYKRNSIVNNNNFQQPKNGNSNYNVLLHDNNGTLLDNDTNNVFNKQNDGTSNMKVSDIVVSSTSAASNVQQNESTPKKSSGFKKIVKKFF